MFPIMLANTISSVNVTNQTFYYETQLGLSLRMENFSSYVYMYQSMP